MLCGGVYRFLVKSGLKRILGRFFHHQKAYREYANPTDEMLASKEYFINHIDDIKYVCSILEDDESVKTYKAMWKFRGTHDYNKLPHFDERKQYFGYNFFDYVEDEKLIDCGAYDGDTIDAFSGCMKKRGIKKYSVVAFEADPDNFKYIEERENVILIKKGVWDKMTTLQFYSDNGADGRLVDSSGNGEAIDKGKVINIPVCCIDDTEECEGTTFIKMDIEGAEWNALHGAEKIIRNNKPKLAICIYHSDEDMVRIPMWIYKMDLGYKFYIRQHSDTRHETVLYATPR